MDYEEPYFTKMQQYSEHRSVKPWEETFTNANAWVQQRRGAGSPSGLGRMTNNPELNWARRMVSDSAINVENTFATCFGMPNSINRYMGVEKDNTRWKQIRSGHSWQWIFLPPGKPGEPGPSRSCKYCGKKFRRQKGWAPPFDYALTPQFGVQPNSIDPVLEGVKQGEARAGKFDVPASIPRRLNPMLKSRMLWHTERNS